MRHTGILVYPIEDAREREQTWTMSWEELLRFMPAATHHQRWLRAHWGYFQWLRQKMPPPDECVINSCTEWSRHWAPQTSPKEIRASLCVCRTEAVGAKGRMVVQLRERRQEAVRPISLSRWPRQRPLPSLGAVRSVHLLCMFVNVPSLTPDKWRRVAGKTHSGAARLVGVCETWAETKGPERLPR